MPSPWSLRPANGPNAPMCAGFTGQGAAPTGFTAYRPAFGFPAGRGWVPESMASGWPAPRTEPEPMPVLTGRLPSSAGRVAPPA